MTPALATVILDPPTAFVAGCILGLISIPLIRRNGEVEVGRTGVFGAAWGVIYGLAVGWFFFARPDWMMAYLRDAASTSLPLAYALFMVALVAFGAAGGVASAWLVARGKILWSVLLTLASAVVLVSVFLLQWKQYVAVGTYAEFHAGTALPMVQSPQMQRALNLSTLGTATASIALLVVRFVRGRRSQDARAQNPRA
jgi:hypothetical protein